LLGNTRALRLFEPDLDRRGSGGSEGTVYLRWAQCCDVRNDCQNYAVGI